MILRRRRELYMQGQFCCQILYIISDVWWDELLHVVMVGELIGW